ncbi:hypothetical protein ACEPPN_017952 [Leptodophora sp. 'Broadleaf-Isolate-01']
MTQPESPCNAPDCQLHFHSPESILEREEQAQQTQLPVEGQQNIRTETLSESSTVVSAGRKDVEADLPGQNAPQRD